MKSQGLRFSLKLTGRHMNERDGGKPEKCMILADSSDCRKVQQYVGRTKIRMCFGCPWGEKAKIENPADYDEWLRLKNEDK